MDGPPIYLDNHSTTRVDPRVLDTMLPYFSEKYGNAASINHPYGWAAGDAVEKARNQVAELLVADPRSLVFTSGATESNNIALKGILHAADPGSHLIINAAEHKAILDPAEALQREGFDVTVLPVNQFGMVDPQQVADAIQPNTVLVSTMFANNEVGTINPIAEIWSICRQRGVLFHTDATQAAGKLPIDLTKTPLDVLSLSVHKMYGPKGVGILYIRRGSPRIKIEPLFDGGGHERHIRSGTLPVPLIVGLGQACDLCREVLIEEGEYIANLRDHLWNGVSECLDNVKLNGHPTGRLSGNASISFEGVNSEALMMQLKDVVALSSGSACTTADPEPSHVLTAMGLSADLIESTIRFGLGRFNTDEEVGTVIKAVVRAVDHLRQLM